MSWDQLLEIQREARKRRLEEVSRPLVACPDDGTPLEDGPGRASLPVLWLDGLVPAR